MRRAREASRSNAEAAKDAKKRQYFSAAFAAFAFNCGVSYSDTLIVHKAGNIEGPMATTAYALDVRDG